VITITHALFLPRDKRLNDAYQVDSLMILE